jgi:hypothetical protein
MSCRPSTSMLTSTEANVRSPPFRLLAMLAARPRSPRPRPRAMGLVAVFLRLHPSPSPSPRHRSALPAGRGKCGRASACACLHRLTSVPPPLPCAGAGHGDAGHSAGKRKVTARVYPRRKAGETVRSTSKPIVLTTEMLEPFFGTPLRTAAWHMGLCPTALKSVCRKLGINRWPYQQSRSQRFAGDEASVGAECEGESERSSYSSSSGAETVVGDLSPSSSQSGEAPEEDAVSRQDSHCPSTGDSSDAGAPAQAPVQDVQRAPRNTAPKRLQKSNGDGPACLSSLMHHRQSAQSTYDAREPHQLRLGQGAGSRVGEHFPPHAHPRMYYGYPGAYSMYSKPTNTFEAHKQRTVPYATAAVHNLAANTLVPAADRSVTSCDQTTLTTHHVQQACREGAEVEVGLARAAQKLRDEEWAGLVQQISAHQAKWSSSTSSSVSEACDEYDGSLCDMSWLCG